LKMASFTSPLPHRQIDSVTHTHRLIGTHTQRHTHRQTDRQTITETQELDTRVTQSEIEEHS